jgi:hypothetical protein
LEVGSDGALHVDLLDHVDTMPSTARLRLTGEPR